MVFLHVDSGCAIPTTGDMVVNVGDIRNVFIIKKNTKLIIKKSIHLCG
jgi:hypothetical protein